MNSIQSPRHVITRTQAFRHPGETPNPTTTPSNHCRLQLPRWCPTATSLAKRGRLRLQVSPAASPLLNVHQTTQTQPPPLYPRQMASNIVTNPSALCFAISNGIEHQGCFPWPPCPATSNDVEPTASAPARLSNNMDAGPFLPLTLDEQHQASSTPRALRSATSLDVEH